MINQIYRLVDTRKILVNFAEEDLNDADHVIVRPNYLSICAADQRYYKGERDKAVMHKKLPMALIHEAVGEVLYDPQGQFPQGTRVVLIPNTPLEIPKGIKENYAPHCRFRSSGYDGFMQNFVVMDRGRIIPIDNIPMEIGSFIELISVAVNAIEEFGKKNNGIRNRIGVFGDGSVGYLVSLLLKKYYPKSKIVVFGKNREKMNYFSFADELCMADDIPEDMHVDHAFECVGGSKSETAINSVIDIIGPQGCISLLGVSENNVGINTRMVLEKGLTLIGNSRSGYEDFQKAVELLSKDGRLQKYAKNIISQTVEINSINDIHYAFESDANNYFKTVMKWNL